VNEMVRPRLIARALTRTCSRHFTAGTYGKGKRFTRVLPLGTTTKWRRTMANEQKNEQRRGSGNFANDPQRASEAGKKGGENSHGGQQSQSGSSEQQGGSERGGSGNFANDPQRASEAGKKGGEHSHDGSKGGKS
jgi:uncharacterized protein